ncbi:nuclear RNA export factor 3-like [Sus scrofa]|uniref:nuclear RNA export factor 3-like n=1 Tax=Sus scrofa TaxID=9823 RepID=UPI000A2AFB6D|nr:nuclear RNA export factor 3-like [Sus scrofa]
MEHTDQMNPIQRRARCWGIYQRRYNYWSEQVTSQEQKDRNSVGSDAHVDTRVRYTPYGIPPYHRRGNFQMQDLTHVNMDTDKKPPEGKVERIRQDETLGSWFKITIPFGIKYEEKWLLSLIQKHCGVPFTPVEFHYEKMQAQFFVENANIAFALRNVSGKIYNEAKERISVFVDPCDAPRSVQKELRSAKVEQMKLTLNRQNEGSQQFLHIQRLRFDPGLMTSGMGTVQNPGNAMTTCLQLYGENVPKLLSLDLSNKKPYQLVGLPNTMEHASHIKNLNLPNTEVRGGTQSVKSAWEMDKVQWLEPDEMCADRNPVCNTSPDEATSLSSILELFPKLLCLDGQETPPATHRGAEARQCLPTCKGSFFGSNELKSLVLQFLQQYYLIHDYGDRQYLLGAYHDEACFSLTIPFNSQDPASSSFYQYLEENRNMKKLKDPFLQVKLLKHTKCDIVGALCVLPQTRHDFSSFVVDTWFQTEMMLCFSVNGVFKEVGGWSQGCVRAFTRTFITIPATSSSLCIVNDELFVREASPSERQSLHFPSQCLLPLPASCSSSPQSSSELCGLSPPSMG